MAESKSSESKKLLPVPYSVLTEYPFGGKTKIVSAIGKKCALITVNVQNDFVEPKGPMHVPGAEAAITKINALRRAMAWDAFIHVVISHPAKHISFHGATVASHNQPLGASIPLPPQPEGLALSGDATPNPDGQPQLQMMWPVHCIADTAGAKLHPNLLVEASDSIVKTGQHSKFDSFSAFQNPQLSAILNAAHISHVMVTGIGYEHWVCATAMDSVNNGFQTYIITDATARMAGGSTTSSAAATTATTAITPAGSGSGSGSGSGGVVTSSADAALEAINLKLNIAHVSLLDAHSLLFSAPIENRRTTAERYLATHNIHQLFERLVTSLVYNKPTDPKQFLIAELKHIMTERTTSGGSTSGSSTSGGSTSGSNSTTTTGTALFNDEDLECMFRMLDPLSKGVLTGQQLGHALESLCVKPAVIASLQAATPTGATLTLTDFKSKVRAGLTQS